MAGFNLRSAKKKRLTRTAGKCANPECQHIRKVDNPLSVDHVVPKALYQTYGLADMYNEEENLVVLCQLCNYEKGSVLDARLPQTKELINKLHTRWLNLNFPQARSKQNTYVFRNLEVKSIMPDTTHMVSKKKALESIYKKQHHETNI